MIFGLPFFFRDEIDGEREMEKIFYIATGVIALPTDC